MTLVYSHPQMSALINWIYVADDFRPTAALHRKDFTPTSMGKVRERLLTRDWHTEANLTTDNHGMVELRGFKGRYDIRIEHNGKASAQSATLSKDTSRTFSIEK